MCSLYGSNRALSPIVQGDIVLSNNIQYNKITAYVKGW